jgi:hypothetical protein
MRELPFSSAAWEKLVNERVTPGCIVLLVLKLIWVPKNRVSTSDIAPPSTLCPEV